MNGTAGLVGSLFGTVGTSGWDAKKIRLDGVRSWERRERSLGATGTEEGIGTPW